LPFDKLKVDRVFVDGVDNSPRARELLKGIVGLGRGLGMIVIAEGAEKQAEVEILRQFGCDQAQGYIFARPAVAADALVFARTYQTEAVQTGETSSLAGPLSAAAA
jgi:EAL domain-containing protein (putative c-di-GMP-specific phosphodiesterase class I)